MLHRSQIVNLPAELGAYDVSVMEYDLMAELDYLQPLLDEGVGRQALAELTWEPIAGAPWTAPHWEDYAQAIDQAVERGVLRVVTQQEYDEDRARRTQETIWSCDDNYPLPGRVDFTREGMRRFREINRRIFGRIPVGSRLDGERLQVRVVSEDLDTCQNCVRAYQQGHPFGWVKDMEHSIDALLVQTSEPFRIGPWRLSRFEVVESGYSVLLSYRLPDGFVPSDDWSLSLTHYLRPISSPNPSPDRIF